LTIFDLSHLIDMIVDRFYLNLKENNYALLFVVRLVPKTGKGLPKTGVGFYCESYHVSLITIIL